MKKSRFPLKGRKFSIYSNETNIRKFSINSGIKKNTRFILKFPKMSKILDLR